MSTHQNVWKMKQYGTLISMYEHRYKYGKQSARFYTQLITFDRDDEYTVKTAKDIKEATDLLEHGFTYIQEIDGIKLYRKRI
jgi:hypothetical protein